MQRRLVQQGEVKVEVPRNPDLGLVTQSPDEDLLNAPLHMLPRNLLHVPLNIGQLPGVVEPLTPEFVAHRIVDQLGQGRSQVADDFVLFLHLLGDSQ